MADIVKQKTPYKTALELLNSKLMTQEQLDEGIDKGLIASPTPSRGLGRRVILGSDGSTQIEPTLYFKGANGLPYTKEMKELRTKFNELKEKYTTPAHKLKGVKKVA